VGLHLVLARKSIRLLHHCNVGEQTLSQASQASETNNAALLYLATPNEALLTIAGCSGVL
jgi:hypothetical protein